jgi:hypothetical protein
MKRRGGRACFTARRHERASVPSVWRVAPAVRARATEAPAAQSRHAYGTRPPHTTQEAQGCGAPLAPQCPVLCRACSPPVCACVLCVCACAHGVLAAGRLAVVRSPLPPLLTNRQRARGKGQGARDGGLTNQHATHPGTYHTKETGEKTTHKRFHSSKEENGALFVHVRLQLLVFWAWEGWGPQSGGERKEPPQRSTNKARSRGHTIAQPVQIPPPQWMFPIFPLSYFVTGDWLHVGVTGAASSKSHAAHAPGKNTHTRKTMQRTSSSHSTKMWVVVGCVRTAWEVRGIK